MKRIEYKFESIQQEMTENGVENITVLKIRSIPYSAQNEEIAKTASADGSYVIYDDGEPEPEPTEQEQLRADVDFLLAMGGVL